MIKFLQRFITIMFFLILVIKASYAQEPVVVQVFYSGYADECSWEIINTVDNSVVLSGGPGPQNAPPYFSYNQTINFFPGEYKFVAYDSYGDGWPSPGAWYNVSPALGIGTGQVNFPTGVSQETNFSVFSSSNIDLGIVSWENPVSSPGLSGSEDIIVKVRNYGTDTVNSLNLSYSTNGGFSYITELYSSALLPGDTLIYTFNQTANFAGSGLYSCVAYVSATGDLMTANDSVYVDITSYASISLFPWTETFSVWPPQDWTFSGSESWLSYTNTSAFCNFYYWNQGSAEMVTPPLNVYSPATLSFDWSSTLDSYSLNDEMKVYISSDFGVTWQLVLEHSGIYLNSYDGATNQSPGSFISESIDLTPYTNDIIYVKFVGTSNLGANLYVDNVSVNLNPMNDLALIEWVYPSEASCGLTSSESITIKVKNSGSTLINGFNLAYSIGGSSYTVESTTQSVAPGDTLEISFTTPADFSTYGVYECQALIINPGDNVLSNDNISFTLKSLNSISSFPFLEDFETGSSNFFLEESNSYANAEIINEGSNYAIKLEGGPAAYGWIGGSSSTTPYQAWEINQSHKSSVFACSVDATTLSSLELLIDLKQFFKYGPAYSYFRVLINGQEFADETGTINFHPQTQSSDPYSTIRFDLTQLAGTQFDLKLEASNKFSSATNPPGNVAFVDNIILREIPPPDAGIAGIVGPVSTCNMSSSETLEIQVENNGSQEISNYNLSYSINGSPFTVNTVTTTISSAGVINYTFPQQIDLSTTGQYLITVAVSLVGDMVPTNDTTTFLVENLSQLPISFSGLLPVYCHYDASSTLSGTPSGGEFSGPGVLGNVFDPAVAGPGTHLINYSVYDATSGCNSIATETVLVNGVEVGFTGLYTGPTLVPVLVEVFYNSNWVSEQSWEIIDEAGNVILSYPNGTSSNGYSHNGYLYLPFGNYTFNAFDVYGDGWNDSWYNITPDFGTGTGIQTYVIPPAQFPGNQQSSQFLVGGQSFMCFGDPAVTLVGSPTGGLFSGPGVSGNLFDPTVAGLGTHTVSYIFTDGTGCTGIDVQTVIIEELPVVDLGQDVVMCDGETTVLDAGISYAHLWSDGSTNQTITVASSGIYSVTVSTELGCEGYDQLNVTVNPLPPVSLGADLNLCPGDIVVLDANIGSQYLWSDGSTLSTLEVSTTNNYAVTVTSSEGCVAEDDITITFHEAVADLGPNQFVCEGETTVIFPGSFTSYLWSNGSTDATLEVGSPNIYTVTVTNLYGCMDDDAISVYFNDLPIVDLGPDFVIEDTVIIIDPGIFTTYLWSNGSQSTVYLLDGSSLPPGPTEIWVEVTNSNGCSNSDTVIVEPFQNEQIIELSEGWSMISTYIDPYNPLVDEVFTSVSTEVLLVKNGSGLVYWPSFGLNLIGNMVIGEGYQVYMSTLQYLTVVGEQVTPELTPFSIPSGWSLMGYLRTTPAPLDTMLNSIVSNILLVKNGDGLVYWPSFGFNGIGLMMPGQGYQVLMDMTVTFTFVSNSIVFQTKSTFDECKYFINTLNTGHNMTLAIPSEAWDSKPLTNDEIGIFSESGLLIGSNICNDENTIITIWGIDPYNSFSSGIEEGKAYTAKHWSAANGSITELNLLSFESGSQYYYNNDIAIVNKLERNIREDFFLGQNFPNPFTNQSSIDFNLPESMDIKISVYSALGEYLGDVCNGNYSKGYHEVSLYSDFSPGIYYYRFITEKYKDVKQFTVINK